MKNVKKIVSLVLSMIMLLSLSATVFADGQETCTITIENGKTGHTYEAYQIFTGTPHIEVNDAGTVVKKTLLEIHWGESTGKTGALTEAEAAALKSASSETFISYVSDTAEPVASSTYSEGKYVISGLIPGYYLVKDKEDSLNGTHDAYTAFILEVVEDSEVTPKSALPTVDKQVWDETADAETGHSDGWGETADHAINETFQFKLIAQFPASDEFKYYDTYKVIFHDSMSAGITFESIKSVTVDGQTVTDYRCTATANQAGGDWTLTIDNIKMDGVNLTDGADVVVIYDAHLNENAKVENVQENKNSVYLQYSNNPNDGGVDLGKTAQDHVWVFTYKVENTKTDENNAPLAGAGFRLYTDAACENEFELIYDETLAAYRPVKGEEVGQEMTSAEATGKFNIVGLDAGTYYLKETTIPDGYNICENVQIVISATHVEAADGASASTTISSEASQGLINQIINQSGLALPETGGIGTTILYIVGSILVLGAVVLLVTKKRMSVN